MAMKWYTHNKRNKMRVYTVTFSKLETLVIRVYLMLLAFHYVYDTLSKRFGIHWIYSNKELKLANRFVNIGYTQHTSVNPTGKY